MQHTLYWNTIMLYCDEPSVACILKSNLIIHTWLVHCFFKKKYQDWLKEKETCY